MVPGDKATILQGFEELSPESRFRRFLTPMNRLSQEQLRYLTEIDYINHYACGVFDLSVDPTKGIGVARYIRSKKDKDVAEAAVAVLDTYHRRGIGTILLQALGTVALENGITKFSNYVHSENTDAKSLVTKLGATTELDSPGVLRMEIDITEMLDGIKDTPVYGLMRLAAKGESVEFLGGLVQPSRHEPQ